MPVTELEGLQKKLEKRTILFIEKEQELQNSISCLREENERLRLKRSDWMGGQNKLNAIKNMQAEVLIKVQGVHHRAKEAMHETKAYFLFSSLYAA